MTQLTPNLELPYPELTDTADVPRDVEALAMKLDALLGGGSGGGGSSTLPLAAAPVLDVGMVGQVRAGRQLSPGDFTSLGLSAPVGLWSLSDLANQGSDGRALTNLGAVPFGVGINGVASSCAVFAGSTGQALYIADAGAADPYRIRAGSVGCWFRTAKRGADQALVSKWQSPQLAWLIEVNPSNAAQVYMSTTGTDFPNALGVSDVCDDRWHFVVGTFDGTALRCYVDGVLEAATFVSGVIFPASTALNVGAQGASASTAAASPHYGRIDEAFIAGDVLTDVQVRLLYAAKLAHTLGAIPTAARLSVHRRRKGPAFAVADFTAQPVRLHNFTGGALSDQGSGGVAFVNNGAAVSVAGADGTPNGAFNFAAASNQSLSSTDAGLPGGLTARSYGCWFKTSNPGVSGSVAFAWGTVGTADARISFAASGAVSSGSGADLITGPVATDGQWHLAITVEDNAAGDGVKRKFYVDGRLVGGSTVLNAITLAGANRFRVGAFADGTAPFTGQIDGAFVCAYAMTPAEILGLWAKGAQDAGGSPKNSGDHVERVDATSVLFIADTLESQHTVDLGVVA
jgi:concanavalin A-like lectin/glucanase superfamily protein